MALFGLVSENLGLLSALGTVFMYVVLTQAWNILGGYAGQISIGHGLFFGLGAYTSAIAVLSLGLNPWIGGFLAISVNGELIAECPGDPAFHVRGATKIYRKACWEAIGGLIRQTG